MATIDEVLAHAGGLGRYQRRMLLHTGGGFFVSSGSLLLPTLLYPRLEDEWAPAFSKEAKVVLDSVFFLGNTLGLLAFGPVGDHLGRRPAVNASLVMLIVAGAACFACSGVVALGLARFCVGFAVGGVLNASFVLQVELASPDRRIAVKVFLSAVGWVSGALWLTLVAYCVRDAPWPWMGLYLAPTVPLLLANTLCLAESPRYLLAKGRHADAGAQLAQLAETNGRPLPPRLRALQPPPSPPPSRGEGSVQRVYTRVMELFHPSLRRRTLLVGLAWFGSTCCYYGVSLGASLPLASDGDAFKQNFLANLLEAPAYTLMLCADRFGRRRTWAAFLLVAAVALILLAAVQREAPHGHGHGEGSSEESGEVGEAAAAAAAAAAAPQWLILTLALMARFGATGASAIVYVAAAEQWPTTCRNLGVNYGASCGRIGSMLSPLMRLLPSPSAVLGGVGAAAALAVLALPETSGAAMPETVKGAAAIGAAVGGGGGGGGGGCSDGGPCGAACASSTSASCELSDTFPRNEYAEGGGAGGGAVMSTAMPRAYSSRDELLGEAGLASHEVA